MPNTRPAALGIREKIIIAYIGLLILLLMLAGVGLSITNVATDSLDSQNTNQNQSINYSADVLVYISDINISAYFSDGTLESEALLRDKLEDARAKVEAFTDDFPIERENLDPDRLISKWDRYEENIITLIRTPEAERGRYFSNEVMPVVNDLRSTAELIIEYNLDIMNHHMQQNAEKAMQSRFLLFGLAILGLILCIGFLGFLRKLLVSPAEEIVQTLEAIDMDELEAEFKYRRLDEIGKVAQAIQAFMVKIRERRMEDVSMFTQLEKRSELALNSIPDGMMVLDTDGNIHYQNRIAKEMAEFHEEGGLIHHWEWNTVRNAFDNVIKTKEPYVNADLSQSIQFFIDQNEHYFLPSAYPLFKNDEELFEVVILMSDVTFLQKLDEMKSDLMSTVSHQLKTPLTAMRMSLRMVLNSKNMDLPDMEKELLETADRESERLHNTIQELLDLARIQAGAISMNLEIVDPTKWLDQIVEEHAHRFEQRNMSFDTQLSEDCPEVRIDVARMNAVIENLLTNCLKYCNEGDHALVRLDCDPDDQHTVLITVKDTGPGMIQKDVNRIFDRFYRGSNSQQPGTGLGLSISREIVQAHGGEIYCRSKEGEGTVFEIRLYPVDGQTCDDN